MSKIKPNLSFLDKIKISMSGGRVSTAEKAAAIPTHAPISVTHERLTIDHLPPEILRYIFETFSIVVDQGDVVDNELEGTISVYVPSRGIKYLPFTQVCRYWRDVAISTPVLWSRIAINNLFHLPSAQSWIQRSKNHPLSIYLSLEGRFPTHKREQITHLLGLLYSHMHRWRDIFINLPTPTEMEEFIFTVIPSEGSSPAVILRSWFISPVYQHCGHINGQVLSRLASFPHPTLQRYAWRTTYIPDFTRLSSSLWMNLQQISFDRTTTGVVHAILKVCINVRVFNIEALVTASSTIGMPTEPTLAHHLQVLHISRIFGPFGRCFDLLRTPQLKTLTFSHHGSKDEITDLENFVERSGYNLERLTVACELPSYGEEEVRKILTSPKLVDIPNVTLRVSGIQLLSTFVNSMLVEMSDRQGGCYAHHEVDHFVIRRGSPDTIRRYDEQYPFVIVQ